MVKGTMRILAKGKNEKVILKVLRILINTSQSNFGDLNLDDACIRDIADVITADNADGFVGEINETAGIEIKRPRGAILAGNFSDDHMSAQEAASKIDEYGEESEQPEEESKE